MLLLKWITNNEEKVDIIASLYGNIITDMLIGECGQKLGYTEIWTDRWLQSPEC